MPHYDDIRTQFEDQGYKMTDGEYEKLLDYARNKAHMAGKDESYMPYLLPDVIKDHFFMLWVNNRSMMILKGANK